MFKKMPGAKTQLDRKRIIVVVLSLLASVAVITAGLILASCNKRKDPGTDPGVNGVITGLLASKKAENPFFSPSSIEIVDSGIYVTDATNFAVYKLSHEGKIEKTVYFSSTVSRVRDFDGKLFVAWGELDGSVSIFDEDLNLVKTVKVGHTPSDVFVKGNTAFVANTFSDTVSVIDIEKGTVTGEIPVSREPFCMAALGNYLYVGCRLQNKSALEEVLSSSVVKIDIESGKVEKTIELQDGAVNVKGIIALDSEIVLTHTVARYSYPTTQLDRGWVNTNGFTVIDTSTDTPTAYLLDEVEHGAANPWGVAVSGDGKELYFCLAGTSEVIVLDTTKFNQKVKKIKTGKDNDISNPNDAIDHIELLSGMKSRIKLDGEGARDIKVYKGNIYVAEYFTGEIAVIDYGTHSIINKISLGEQPEMTPERLGESIWFSAKYTYQNWESCSSCHPYARPDGLNWDEEGDGIGTPKNTKSMMFSHRTPPVLTTGCVEYAEDNVMGTFREAFRSAALEDEKIFAVDSFLRSQLPVDSPYLTSEGAYSASALRGKELFAEFGCAACHPAPLYTDMKFHKSPYLGTDGTWEDREFITPTLVEIWRSAPYTYCGCETDIKSVIKKFVRKDITDDQLSDLAKFVLSIGVVDEYYGVEQVFVKNTSGDTVISRLEKGGEIINFTIRRQLPGEDKTYQVKITLCSADGSVIEEKIVDSPALKFNTFASVPCNIKIPENLATGSYLEILVKDSSGADLATPYRLNYNG